MKKEQSAGLLMYREKEGKFEFLLVHHGGPFWRNKDLGTWTIPKGHIEEGEEKLNTAIREFKEETGFDAEGTYEDLGMVTYQASGKDVYGWAFKGDCDPTKIKSNTCEIEWPPHSGLKITIPEVDKGEFFSIELAKQKINPAQLPFLERIEKFLGSI